MRTSIAVIRDWQLARTEGHDGPMNAASLVKQLIGHLALEIIEDLDEPVHGEITVRHVLSHTTGLPNWRPEGEELVSLRPPGVRWGYSGEGFVLLQRLIERRTGQPIDQLARLLIFDPLAMNHSRFDEPESGYHGYRPLLTTAGDYGRFLAHVLAIDDERWRPLCRIDDELAWSAGWGLELGPPIYGWQWGANEDASNFVIGCPALGRGVVVLTDAPEGRNFYRSIVENELPGNHPSLRVEQNPAWLELFA